MTARPEARFAGASVVVIGGSSGSGLATALMAREAGASVTIAARDPERLAAARDAVGGDTRAIPADAADEASVRRLFEETGRLDHLVVLAGPESGGRVADVETETFREAFDVRFWGALYACKYGAPRMDAGGSITLCSGLLARRPRAGRSIGAASTTAVEAFGRAMALELAPIRVNTICPGPIDTPRLGREFGDRRDEIVAATAERVPLKRIGRPEEIAGAILFLMGNEYVTGITLLVDGGLSLA